MNQPVVLCELWNLMTPRIPKVGKPMNEQNQLFILVARFNIMKTKFLQNWIIIYLEFFYEDHVLHPLWHICVFHISGSKNKSVVPWECDPLVSMVLMLNLQHKWITIGSRQSNRIKQTKSKPIKTLLLVPTIQTCSDWWMWNKAWTIFKRQIQSLINSKQKVLCS